MFIAFYRAFKWGWGKNNPPNTDLERLYQLLHYNYYITTDHGLQESFERISLGPYSVRTRLVDSCSGKYTSHFTVLLPDFSFRPLCGLPTLYGCDTIGSLYLVPLFLWKDGQHLALRVIVSFCLKIQDIFLVFNLMIAKVVSYVVSNVS